MEDSADVGSVATVTESSTMTVTVTSVGESLMQSMDCEGQIEGSYNEGDEEEIMVEVVGSDVFVDGVSGNGDGLGKEILGTHMESFGVDDAVDGDIGSTEVVNLGGPVWEDRNETAVKEQGVPGERVGDVAEMEGVEVASGPISERTDVVTVRVDVAVGEEGEEGGLDGGNILGGSELVDGGKNLDDEVWNPGIDAVPLSSSPMVEPEEAREEVVGEEAPLGVQEVELRRKDESLTVDNQSPVVDVIGIASQASVEGSFNHPGPESDNHLKEAILGENVKLVSAEESLPSTFAGAESNIADQNCHSSGESDRIVDNHTCDSDTSRDNFDADLLSSINPPKDATGGEVAAVECKVSSSPSHEVLNNDLESSIEQHKSQVKTVSGSLLVTETEYSSGQTQVVEHYAVPVENNGDLAIEPEVFSDDKNDKRNPEDLLIMNQEATHGSHDHMHAAPEQLQEHSSVVERGEWIGMDIDEVLDFNDEATGSNAPAGNLISVENAEDVSEPRRSTNIVVPAEMPMPDVEADVQDCQVTLPLTEDEELVQLDVGISKEQNQVVTGETELITVKDEANIGEDIVDADAFIQKNQKLDTFDADGGVAKGGVTEESTNTSSENIGSVSPMELSVESQAAVKVPVCDDVDRRSLLAEENDLKVEEEDINRREDGVMENDHPEGTEVGKPNASVPKMESNVEGSSSIQEKKQDGVARLNEKLLLEVHGDRTDDTFAADEVSKEGTYTVPISDVQASAGPQTTVDSTCSLGEGNVASLMPDGNQKSTNLGIIEEVSVAKGDLTMGTSVCQIASSVEAFSQVVEREGEFCGDNHILQAVVPDAKFIEDQQGTVVDEQYADGEQIVITEEDITMGEHVYDMDQLQNLEDQMIMTSSSLHQLGYLRSPENEGEFSTSDLVWGKVRSHPWWPGQVFDSSDASDKAVKYYKKDCFLVAYFGDQTFAWNDASVLKPFRSLFSQIERQSYSEAFQNAVNCALDEVARRVKLGLSCSCIPKDTHERIECQIVENTGIRKESTRRYGEDQSTGASSFEPDKLLEHVKSLAQSPFNAADRLELVLAKAQLSAFCHFKGYRPPPSFESREVLLENNTGTSELGDELDHKIPVTEDGEEVLPCASSHKRKQSLKDSLQPKKKEKSMSELMGDMAYSPDGEDDSDSNAPSKAVSTSSGKKMKAVDSIADGSDRRISIYAAKVSTTASVPKPSFKVGECIRRVASQLTGSASILKCNNDQSGSDASLHISENSPRGSMGFPTEISSIEDMLSQLQLAARDPKKGYGFLNNIIIFFSVFRNSVVRKHTSGKSGSGRKRKISQAAGGSTEEFEFDDTNDSYWTDRIIQNYSEEQLLQNIENGDEDYRLIVSEPDKSHKPSRRSHSRKQYSDGNYVMPADEPTEDFDRRKLESSPAELTLTFAEGDRLPSEIVLNRMFKRFGPLKESETEVDPDSHRARVIFKKGADAEVAYSSAGTFNIFGSILVSYQLSYSPSATIKAMPLLISYGQEDVADVPALAVG